MAPKNDPETLKIPAYMRTKAIVKRDRQRLLWTAWDRKEAGVKPNSPRAVAPVDRAKRPQIAGPVVPGRTLKTPSHTKRAVADAPSTQRLPAYLKRNEIIKTSLPDNVFETDDTPAISSCHPQKFPLAGETTHYLGNIKVAIIKTTVPLKIGDVLLIEGDGFVFTQPVTEMQIDRKPVKRAKKGSHIGLKVAYEATVNGSVHLLHLRG